MKIYYSLSPYITKAQREKQFVSNVKDIPEDARLMSQADDSITIEFDAPCPDTKTAIAETAASLANSMHMCHFIQTSHNGFSDYLRIPEIAGLESLEHQQRKKYRKMFYDRYVPDKWRKFVDESFTSSFRWMPIIGRMHWKKPEKPEYTEEKIVREYNNIKANTMEPDLLQAATKSVPQKEPTTPATIPTSCAFINYITTTKLPEGKRNEVVSKNLAVFLKGKLNSEQILSAYCNVQNMPVAMLNGWLKKVQDGEIRKFSCPELKKYCRDAGLNICKLCNHTLHEKPLPMVQLPVNRLVCDFINDIIPFFQHTEKFFFKTSENEIVEIRKMFDKSTKKRIFSFSVVDGKRMINFLEEIVCTFVWVKVNDEFIEKPRTANQQHLEIAMKNSRFLACLNTVNRFYNSIVPFLNGDGELFFPKRGYNAELEAYFTDECPEITIMPDEDAKAAILDILSDFCFKSETDRVMAIAYLITPACRGLYNRITSRTPLVLIMANRERAGKDFLAGVVGILYEGIALDDSPFAVGGKRGCDNEELRKKITSAVRQGRRRMHSANNKGLLNNAILEQVLTSESWSDRILGRNEEVQLNNEMDFSLSANVGLTYPADLAYRSRPINLFFAEENPNARVFKRPDLHGYVKQNRSLILSAVCSLVQSWFNAKQTQSECVFTSFPEWARVVGGVMVYHKLGNPCVEVVDDNIGGDQETLMMKNVFTYMVESDYGKKYTCSEIISKLMEKDAPECYFDLSDRSGQTRFGILIKKFNGRVLSNIKMRTAVQNNVARRIQYVFEYMST